MVHAYVVICMVLNSTMCMNYEIVPFNFDPVTSQMHCLRGGVIFNTEHSKLDLNGVEWETKGGVRCIAEPPRVGEIEDWVASLKAKIKRLEPQIK